ncbi:MAG: LamG domain-containing protein [Phycisphaerae bacterium]|nr:LamG domain-containing protein [Phycisphaerae bacterium]
MCGKLTNLLSVLLLLGLVGTVESHAGDAVAIWLFDDGAGDVAIDSTGNGYDGSLRNSPTWGDGVNGGGLWFSSAEANKVIAPVPHLNTLTITMWALYTDLPSTNIGLLHFQTGEDDNTDPASKIIGMWVENTSLLWGRIIPARAGNVNFPKNATVEANVWNHFAMVINAESGKATQYFNGEAVGEVDYPGELTAFTFANIGRQGGESWEGGIDEVAIFDGALSPDEIKAVMSGVGGEFPLASGPDPANGAMLEATWVNLGWRAGEYAVSHDVYLGDNFDDVNNGTGDTFQGNQTGTTLIAGFVGFPYPDGLVPGTTYYWRIDEVNDANAASPWKGDLWSFWVPPKKAYEPSVADGAKFVRTDVELSWTAGFGAKLHTVYFGDDLDTVTNATGGAAQSDTTYSPGALETDKTYYWRIDEFEAPATHTGDVWSFTTVPDVAITEPNLVGLWTFDEGQGATAVDWSGHGNHGKVEGDPQWIDGYELGALELDGSDDVIEVPLQPSVTFEQGDSFSVLVWISTEATPNPQDGIVGNYRTSTAPFWLLIANPEGGATMYVRDVDSAHSTVIASPSRINDGNWHHLAGVRDQQTRRLRLYVDGQLVVEDLDETENINSGQSIWIGDHLNRYYDGLIDDLRIYNKALTVEDIQQLMLGDSKLAGSPVPDRTALVDIRDATSLSWSAGDTAASHDVYFGTNRDVVAGADNSAPEFQGNQAGTSLSLADLAEFGGGDYYWRIDEVEADGTVIAGTIWKFTVPDYLIVDDFESYNDLNEDEPGSNRIYLTWIDGFGTTTNGAVAGNLDPPFMSQGRKSAQAMPVSYNNAGMTSEVTRTLVSKKDWTAGGVTKLSLWLRGDSANATDRVYVALNGNAVVHHDDPAATQLTGWKEWIIDLAAFGIDLTNVNSITIGIGTKDSPVAGGGQGQMYFDDIRLYRP